MLSPNASIEKVKDDILYSTYIDGLIEFKEKINKMVDEQIIKIEDNQDLIIKISYISSCGKFRVEKGIKADYIINGYLGKAKVLEEVECKRKRTKKYNAILEQLKNKYNPDIVTA